MIARFLPVVRTFAPIVAGMVNMDMRKFSFYNIIGAFLWAGSIVTAGFLLGNYDWVKNNLDKIIIGIVVVTTAPVLIKMIASRKKKDPLPADQLNS
jgi:membrane-associated protein